MSYEHLGMLSDEKEICATYVSAFVLYTTYANYARATVSVNTVNKKIESVGSRRLNP